MKDGWKLEEVEEIDLGWYIDLINYSEEKKWKEQSNALDAAGL